MKALVFSYDDNLQLGELLIKCYQRLLGVDYFEFIVPINTSKAQKFYEKFEGVETVVCKPDVLSTARALIDSVNGEQLVYWCIDDRYPVELDRCFYNEVKQSQRVLANEVNGIKLLHWKEKLTGKAVEIFGSKFRQQLESGMFGFWHHQFIKAEFLEKAFFDYNTERINLIPDLNRFLHERCCAIFDNGIFVPARNKLILGETLIRGKLTINCIEELQKYSCEVPVNKKRINKAAFFKDFRKQQLNGNENAKFQ